MIMHATKSHRRCAYSLSFCTQTCPTTPNDTLFHTAAGRERSPLLTLRRAIGRSPIKAPPCDEPCWLLPGPRAVPLRKRSCTKA